MEEDELIKNLNILEINNIEQLKEGNIDYWWNKVFLSKRFKEYDINQKNNDLILINNAREELNKINIDKINNALISRIKKIKSDKNKDNNIQNKIEKEIRKINTNQNIEFSKENKSQNTDQKTSDNFINTKKGNKFYQRKIPTKKERILKNNLETKKIKKIDKLFYLLVFIFLSLLLILSFDRFSISNLLFNLKCNLRIDLIFDNEKKANCISENWKES